MNLAALGITALPVGLVGDDEAGKALLQIFRKNKISVSGITKLKSHVTTTKSRVLAYFVALFTAAGGAHRPRVRDAEGYPSRSGGAGSFGTRVRSGSRCGAAERLWLWRGFFRACSIS